MKTEKIIQDMAKKVDEFQREILKVPYKPNLPEKSRYGHMTEELSEIIVAHDGNDINGVVDGLVDLIYVALGTLLQMGVPPTEAFDIVHDANMKKRGAKTERHDYDAIKPEGWVPPDHAAMLEKLEILHQVSPVFVDLTKLRIKKGKNYNSGSVKRSDHFPLGDLSYFQVIWMKMCRVRSLTESMTEYKNKGLHAAEADNRRLIERELNDIMVYSCFWAEFMRGLEI